MIIRYQNYPMNGTLHLDEVTIETADEIRNLKSFKGVFIKFAPQHRFLSTPWAHDDLEDVVIEVDGAQFEMLGKFSTRKKEIYLTRPIVEL